MSSSGNEGESSRSGAVLPDKVPRLRSMANSALLASRTRPVSAPPI